MNNVCVSIIIPAYNVEGYIEACLDSVLAQTFDDFEVIVIDDGSTDNTGALSDGYARRDGRVSVIHKQNGGVSAARNTGIEAAGGQYFLFYDGDDFVEPDAVGELARLIRDIDADVVIYGYHRYRDGRVEQTCIPVFAEGVYEGGSIITGLLSRFTGFSFDGINRWLDGDKDGMYVENPALWRCIIKADIVRNNGLAFDVDLKVGEDTVFISDLLSCAKRCHVTHKCYYYLVYRDTSAISTYEKNGYAKLENKIQLAKSRYTLTDRIQRRLGVSILQYWQGNIVMSVLELALLFAGMRGSAPFMERYRSYLSYAKMEEVTKTVRLYKPVIKPAIKYIPFMVLKLRWNLPLFICAYALSLTRYRFVRQ